MKVWIVSRTKMAGGRRCIGGLAANGDSVRLLTETGGNHDADSPLQIGQIWDVQYQPRPNVTPPHIEDVLVSAQKLLMRCSDLRALLLKRIEPWEGSIYQLFDKLVRFTGNNNGYVSKECGVPDYSTGFWIPDCDLNLRNDRKHYDYSHGLYSGGLSYVGEPKPEKVLAAGTLIRVSLARWWKPSDSDIEERCYLQLSGWYD